jgi:hypothetical protein
MVKKKKINSYIVAIDPGPETSGVICMQHNEVTFIDTEMDNEEVIEWLQEDEPDMLACEGIVSHGMPVGNSTIYTCYMIGRIQQVAKDYDHPFMLIVRPQIKMHLCHSMKAQQKNIRQALIDLFPATGGGKTPQIGIKSNKGPLYGVGTHAWSALAIAVYARDHM